MKSITDKLPAVEEQTEFDNPIKIRWSGNDRARVRRGLRAAVADDYIERGIAYPVMTRQKTQIVIKTEEELEAFKDELSYKAKHQVQKRILDEIEEQLNPSKESSTEDKSEEYKRREDVDMDVLLNEIVVPHAEKAANDVWPGGTVDVDEIDIFWNSYLSSCAGRAYYGSAVPDSMADGRLAIGLAPEYYYRHGLDELLRTVRHELIHIWAYEHPDVDSNHGHGPRFKAWLDEMDTDRYCKHW